MYLSSVIPPRPATAHVPSPPMDALRWSYCSQLAIFSSVLGFERVPSRMPRTARPNNYIDVDDTPKRGALPRRVGSHEAGHSNTMSAPLCLGARVLSHDLCTTPSPQLPRIPTMDATQQLNGRDATLSELNAAIEALNYAREASVTAPTKGTLGPGNSFLSMRRVGVSSFRWSPLANVHRSFWPTEPIVTNCREPVLTSLVPSTGEWMV